MPDFLAENNICGQTILQLVSRGNAIIAELLRLKDYIPKVYHLESKSEVQQYGDIILDFSYFKIEESQNAKIESVPVLRDLDDEFKENNIEIITRFYLTFESVHSYVTDLNHFLDEIDEGVFIHQTLETIFTDLEGKQLLCEALYLYGLMLLITDTCIDGIVRERLLVSYYRYTPQRSDTQSKIEDICKLMRYTAYNTPKKPANYPQDYFSRIKINSTYVDMVIGHLRSDDIYSQLSVYPLPKHRSNALAQQASMLFVTLFFSSDILHAQTAIMREIVDKYFPDNWVLSIYMGFVVNLCEWWEPFRAAKLALNNTLDTGNIKNYAVRYGTDVVPLLKTTNAKLKEGNVTKDNLLGEVNNLLNLLRDCNCTLRWLMLHTVTKSGKVDRNKKVKQLREMVANESKYEQVQLFKLLLNTAQLELLCKDLYKTLLEEKEKQWTELKEDSHKSLVELSEVFSGTKPLTRIQKNTHLEQWFLEIAKQIETLNQADMSSSRKLVQLIQALEEVQQFHQLESNMQIVQFLTETRKSMHQMIRNMNIKEDVLITLQIVADLSYAWELIDCFTPIMQTGIKKEPTLVIKLRAIFLKLASVLELPLLRINQAHSEDLVSVSQYYSGELEIYVRKVLQIIPKMMFEKMARIIEIQTSVLKEIPTRLDKDKLREYAQLNERFEFAELTNSISVFSQGMRMMKSTLVGVICLDPKRLLEDGIRKELVSYIYKALHDELIFSARPKPEELEQRLTSLGRLMDGYKRSFEYIQDYININGLKIWQEEVTRIINYNVEQECNTFLRNKVQHWESAYQSRIIPIPLFPSTDNISATFIGRLAREIIRLTDGRQSVYLEQTSSWYDPKTHKCIFNKETVALVASSIEISGLVGLDRLFSFMITSKLQQIARLLENKNVTDNWINILGGIRKAMQHEVANPVKFYQNCVGRTTKIWNEFLESMLVVGQLQLLRNLIAFHLNKSAKFNAKNLGSSLRALNSALLNDIKNETGSPSAKFMSILSPYFDFSGLNNPFQKLYITSKLDASYCTTIFMFVIAHLHKLFFLQQLNGLTRRGNELMDGTTVSAAVHTLIKQFHNNLNENFVRLLSNYIMSLTSAHISSKNTDLPVEAVSALHFLVSYTNYSETSRKYALEFLPEEITHLQQSLLTPIS